MLTLNFYTTQDFSTLTTQEEWKSLITISKVGAQNLVKIEIEVEDSSYRYRALMQRPQLVLKFYLPYFVEFPVGTWCVFNSQTYTLNSPENIKRQGTRKIEYSMTLGTMEDKLSLYKFRNMVDGRLKWSMCAKPHEFIEEICKNLNQRDGIDVWYCQKSNIIEATEKTIEFNHTYCDAVLNSVAETFETEYEIIGHNNGRFEIALRKVEYFKDSPLPLSYGKGNGFVPGVGRSTESDGAPIKRLYVQGGERNIDRSTYGKDFGYTNNPAELRLPKAQILDYEGRKYISDEDGYYIERYDKISDATKEDSLDCSEIYPSYVGTVSKVEVPKPEKNFYDILDDKIPSKLDFNSYIIAGESMTLIFQSGMLAGREFEVKYKHNDRRWELVPLEQDGIIMPNETFKPVPGDTYAIFGIMLPAEYICENDTKTGAAWKMFEEAARYLYEHEEQKFTFSGELQSLYAKRNWPTIGQYMKIGSYIHFTDEKFAPSGVDIRVIGIKEYINAPYAPTLEISNSIQSPTTASSQLEQIDNTDVKIDDTKKEIINFTKRRFRDAQETLEMLEDAQLANFTGGITPVTIQTMAMLVGDESLQFLFGRTIAGIGKDGWGINVEGSTLKADGGYLRHMTLQLNQDEGAERVITSGRDENSFLTWRMLDLNVTAVDERCYLYARVRRTGFKQDETTGALLNSYSGEWVVDKNSHSLYESPSHYYLLVGILNSEYLGERSFATMFGFTEILPGQITTDVVKDSSGESYFDLARNRFKLGDKLEFNIDGTGAMKLRGALVQNSGGNESPLPCYRGVYNSTTAYYRGDVVSYTASGITSTYICMVSRVGGLVGVAPTNTLYWAVYAMGSKGDQGEPGKDGTNGKDGINGVNGLDAPIMVFRGNYDSSQTYYGNRSRVDVVRYDMNGDVAYFVALTTAPNGDNGFANIPPINSQNSGSYWKNFGASFESVATSLLLAEKATIGNWFIYGDCIASTHGTVNGRESDEFTNANFKPDVILDGSTGELLLYNDNYPRVRISNQSVASLFNESLVKEATISRQGQKQNSSIYFMTSDTNHPFGVGLLCTITIGQMNENSVINISNFAVGFYVPSNTSYPSATMGGTINGTEMIIYIKKNGTTVETFKGASGTSASGVGARVSHSMNGASYTVPTGGQGNYTIECYLTNVRISSSMNGNVSAVNIDYLVQGSYVHGGFNRTVIGNDGLGSFWDNSAFAFTKNNLIARFGNIGFKVSADGIQKTTNAQNNTGWTNI